MVAVSREESGELKNLLRHLEGAINAKFEEPNAGFVHQYSQREEADRKITRLVQELQGTFNELEDRLDKIEEGSGTGSKKQEGDAFKIKKIEPERRNGKGVLTQSRYSMERYFENCAPGMRNASREVRGHEKPVAKEMYNDDLLENGELPFSHGNAFYYMLTAL